jgi:NADPH-dependent ferric siderophore reductase
MRDRDSTSPQPDRKDAHPLVLVVASNGRRREVLTRCVRRQAPGSRIEVAGSYFDAMAHAMRLPAHLLILDLSLDSVLMPALSRFLEASAPQVQVHVFDDAVDPVDASGQPALRDDGPAMTLLQTSLQAYTTGQPLARAQRPPPARDREV